jgi:hypothetical protein
MRVALEEWLAKTGPVVTPTQVGSAVRQRLGAHLDKRREHVRAAMQSVQPDDLPTSPRPASGTTPVSSHSHSGVVETGVGVAVPAGSMDFRARAPSHPMLGPGMTLQPAPAAGLPAPALPPPRLPPLPIVRSV